MKNPFRCRGSTRSIRGCFRAGLRHAVVLAGLFAVPFAVSGEKPKLVPIPDVLIKEITQRTFAVEGSKPVSHKELEARAGEVRSFLLSMGGDSWYAGYLHRFSAPALEEEYKVATLFGLFETQLGLYYLRTQLTPRAETGSTVCESANPTTAAFCALAVWDSARIHNDREALMKFVQFAERLKRAQKNGRWEWSTDLPSRGLRAPWISGLTQSLGISVMLRAFQFTNDLAYYQTAKAALRWLKLPASRNGVATQIPEGVWYEEYPNRRLASHVLNGHMWALFGIWDFYRVSGEPEAKQMFDEGISALEATVKQYDVSGWSVYSRENRSDYVSGAYQQFIIEQLRVLETITGSAVLATQRALWECSFMHDALFVHEAATQFNKVNGLKAPRPAYPRDCARLQER